MFRRVLLGLCIFTLTACAHRPAAGNYLADPYENFNRAMYQFNQHMDDFFFKPAATFYKEVVPWPVRHGVSNVFNNLNEIPTIANDLLQFNLHQALMDVGRFIFNTTVGIGGLWDPATHLGLPKHTQDFGLTLARWGYRDSSYIVLPFLGPSTLRDAAGMPPNYYLSAFPYMGSSKTRTGLLALDMVNYRANLLGSRDLLYQAAIDPYVFVRNAYLQRRAALIRHNNHPKGEHLPSTPVLDPEDEAWAVGGTNEGLPVSHE